MGFLFSCFVRASKMSCFTAFSREIDAFDTSPSTSPASFSTSPACPTNPSITNKSWATKSKKKKVAGGLTAGSTKMMIQIGGHFSPCKRKVAGGLGAAAALPMMFAEVMIRIGVQFNLCKKSKKVAGGSGGPPMMFYELMIQLGVQSIKSL